MKIFNEGRMLYLLSFVMFGLFSFTNNNECNTEKQKSQIEMSKTTDKINTKSSNSLLYKQYSQKTVFFDKQTKVFYFIQHTNTPNLPSILNFVELNQSVLKLRDDKNTVIEFSFLSSSTHGIFGFGSFEGQSYIDQYLLEVNGSFIFNDDDDIQALSCTCVATNQSSNCAQGGAGSSGCSVTDGGGVGTIDWDNSCSVNCSSGYYSCCNELTGGNETETDH